MFLSRLSNAMDRGTPGRVYLVALITFLVVIHGVAPGRFKVDAVTLGLLGILVVIVLAPYLQSASLPGGTGLHFREELDELKKEADAAAEEQVRGPQREPGTMPGAVRAREEAPGTPGPAPSMGRFMPTQQSPDEIIEEILQEASRSPKVGLMLLSAELDRAVRDTLVTTGWATPSAARSLRGGIGRLVEVGGLTPSAASAVARFMEVRNEIIHGRRAIDESDVLRAIDAGIPLLRSILSIPRERNAVAYVNVPLYADRDGHAPLEEGHGVVLETVSPQGTVAYRIFPTTRDDFKVGKEVTWEWNLDRRWGRTWYRDPETGEVKLAWDGAGEFAGRHIDEV